MQMQVIDLLAAIAAGIDDAAKSVGRTVLACQFRRQQQHPPEQALVLCVDEKSQIQALDRTQSGLPLKKGRCGTMTQDYKRNDATTLFAA